MKKTSVTLYEIIKFRKHKTTIDYFDYERIIGYDFLTGSKSFDDILYNLSGSDDKSIKVVKFLEDCNKKDNFTAEKPLTDVKSGIAFMSNRFNEIDDYLTMNEINFLKKLKSLSIEEFYDLDFSKMGFNNYINSIFNAYKVFKVRDLFFMEGLLTNIDSNIIKIVYTKVNAIRENLYNIKTRNEDYIPISRVIEDKDFRTYNKLRRANIYTVSDLKKFDNKLIKCRK